MFIRVLKFALVLASFVVSCDLAPQPGGDGDGDGAISYLDGTKTANFQDTAGLSWLPGNVSTNSYSKVLSDNDFTAFRTFAYAYETGDSGSTDGVLSLSVDWPTDPTSIDLNADATPETVSAGTDYKVEIGLPGFNNSNLHDLSAAGSKVSLRIYIPQDYKDDGSLALRLFAKDSSYNSRYSEIIQAWRFSAGGWFTISWDLAATDNGITIKNGAGTLIDTSTWFADGWNTVYDSGTPIDTTIVKLLGIAFSANDFNDANGNAAVIDSNDKILIDWIDDGIAAVF